MKSMGGPNSDSPSFVWSEWIVAWFSLSNICKELLQRRINDICINHDRAYQRVSALMCITWSLTGVEQGEQHKESGIQRQGLDTTDI